jgi:arylformamidase
MNEPFGATDWRSMTQEERDRGLNNGAAVAGSADIVAGWDRRSAELRGRNAAYLDLRYGPRERNRIDFLKAGDGDPTLVFIHGGYWQMRAKENFTVFASGPLAYGINVAMIGYTLAPDATMDEIVGEMHAALDFLGERLPAIGGDPKRMAVSGWSAGGHLAVMALGHPLVKAGLAISGVYDLEPVRHSYLNAKLGRQTADFAARRASLGLPVTYEEIRGADHFSIMNQMVSPSGRLTTLIRQLMERSCKVT